jgi:8-oxo-dGTP pyrophosphatase MutT (NUDIX family)
VTEPDATDTVPIRKAATVMIIADRPGLEVLLVHRTAKVVFGPGHWVFPGGRVNVGDDRALTTSVTTGLTETEAQAKLERSDGAETSGLAWWVAAARETFEEAGVLLQASDGGQALDGKTLTDLRAKVLDDEERFVEHLADAGVVLDLRDIEEVARFITPEGPPRRFDTHFFVARAPADQEASHDAGEIVNHRWIDPDEAIERWRQGDMELMTPTIRMLQCLGRYRSVEEVMAAARSRHPYRRVRVADPRGAYRLVLPGEEGFETAELEVESGWVRLWDPSLTD